MLIDALGGVCLNCGSTDRLEFDHVLPEDKVFDIAPNLEISLERLLPELQKCQILCRNCHANKTNIDNGHQVGGVHGLTGTYTNYGCRCDECRAVWAKSRRKYQKSLRTRQWYAKI